MEDVKDILTRCREILNRCKVATAEILQDPILSDWRKIKPQEHIALFQSLGLPHNIIQAHSQYSSEAETIFHQIEICENEVGSLEADLSLKISSHDKSLIAAQQAENKCSKIEQPMATLSCYWELLTEANTTLRNELNLNKLIPLARDQAKSAADFDLGLKVYKAVTEDEDAKGNSVNVYDYFELATKLESRMHGIDFTNLPGLAYTILKKYTGNILTVLSEVKNYIDFINHDPDLDKKSIRNIKDKLAGFKNLSIPAFLSAVEEETLHLAKVISGFQKQEHILDELNYLDRIINDVDSLSLAIKNDLLPQLNTMMADSNSLINPESHSLAEAKNFFAGGKGLWRMFRMIILSFMGEPVITETELQKKLREALGKCNLSREAILANISQMETFADNFFGEYKKPFPFEDLLATLQATFDKYANHMESYIDNFTIEVQNQPSTVEGTFDGTNRKKAKFGKLIHKLLVRIDNLTKLTKE